MSHLGDLAGIRLYNDYPISLSGPLNNYFLVQPQCLVANGICNEADLQALYNLKSLLSDPVILKVIFKSHVKLGESWWEACESREFWVRSF